MKTPVLMSLVAVLATVPPAYSQNADSVVPVISGTAGSGRVYVGGAGTYRQIEENVNALANSVITAAGVTQAEDRDFVLVAVSEIHNAYIEYANALVAQELMEMNASGIRGNTVSIEDFMRVTSGLKAKKEAFESLLIKNASINKSVLPSNYTVIANSEGNQQQVPSVGNIDLSSVVAEYKSRVETELNPQLASYSHIKVDIYGQVLTIQEYGSLLQPSFSSVPTLNTDKIAELTGKMTKLRSQSRNVGDQERRDFVDALRNEYNDFTRRYGDDYQYVVRSDDKDEGPFSGISRFLFGSGDSRTQTGRGDAMGVPGVDVSTDMVARNEAFKRLIDVFWMRSYLRLSQGIQICAVQPKMVQASNFGALQAVEALKQLRTEPACTKNELEDALEYSRRILIYSGAQADHIFGENGFMEAGLLNKLGSAVTFALGKRPTAEALHMLIQLVYADIQEELIMATPGQGLRRLREIYAARYQSNSTQKDYYRSVRCSVDYDPDSCGEMNVFDETPGVGMEQDVRAIFVDLKSKVTLSKDLIDQANRIEQTLAAARSNSDSNRRSRGRVNAID